ncbi:MAG TPA: DUF2752 domain-containing protein [Longimicrobium sp.]|jgi:hypothetical protein
MSSVARGVPSPFPAARTAAVALGTTAAAAACAVLYRFDPLAVRFYPRCLLYLSTGIYCPGCGALRAMHALLHGRVVAALGYNALLVTLLPFLGYAITAQAFEAWAGRPVLPTVPLSGRMARAVLWVFILFTVLRNIPVYPLNVLAP